MALTLANRVRETTTTTGTGTVTLAGAVTGYQAFSVIGNANTTYYTISGQGTSEWEVGIGTYTLSGTTLSRDTVLASSNAGSLVNFSAGTKDAFVTYPSSKSVYLDASGNASALGTPASGTVTNLTGTASININGTVGATTPSTLAATTGAFSGVVSLAAGTVTAPSIYLSTDTGTGLYRIGANNDGFAINGSKVLDIASTGLAVTGTLSSSAATGAFTGLQVGTGGGPNAGWILGNHSSTVAGIWNTGVTPSLANYSLASTASTTYINGSTGVDLYANNGTVATIRTTGVAVTGTLSSSAATGAFTGLQVGTGSGANTGLIIGNYTTGVGGIWCTAVTPSTVNYVLAATTTVVSVNAPSGGTVNLNTNNVTTMSINSTGHTVGGASSPVSGVYGTNSFKTSTANQTVLNLTQDASSSPFGMFLAYGAVDPNNTSSEFLYFTGNGTLRFSVRSNGGVVNFQANDANLSDLRTKKNIELAGNYLDKICAIPVKTFLYKDQTDEFLNLGVIAQDVEAVAPELIDSSGFGETPEDGVPLKSIYQTDLQFALMKAIQELAAKVAQLEAA